MLTAQCLEEAEQAHRICIINFGRVIATGTPASLKDELCVTSSSTPPIGIVRCSELGRQGLTPDGSGPMQISHNGRDGHWL